MSDSTVSCILCQRSEETKTTGTLSTKDEVTAHQNCLLFSSGIFCRDSPEFDDLFGFSVEDVLKEVKRGSKLTCNHCKRKGATAGCEVKRCQKSYHYPCAVKEGAKAIEDEVNGSYVIYCSPHYERQIPQESINRIASSTKKPRTSKTLKNSSEPGPSKNGNGAGPSAHNSDSSSSNSTTRTSSKRWLGDCDKQEETRYKHKPEGWKKRISDSSNSVDNDNEDNMPMDICAPLESDIDESANSVPELKTVPEVIRRDIENPAGSPSGNHVEDENDKDTIIDSDAESESLLLPVEICVLPEPLTLSTAELSPQTESAPQEDFLVKADIEPVKKMHKGSRPEQKAVQSPGQHTSAPSVPRPSSADLLPSFGQSKSPPCTSPAIFPAPPEPVCVSIRSSSSPVALPSVSEPKIDSTTFWKSCNVAGCTQAIFTDFINSMNDISNKIQSDQASQEEYDLALSVMAASGKLAEFVAKQQEELQKKQTDLQKAAAAMKEVVSALRK
ncbi:uncharacterized protein phf11 isoform X7 [Archocentrus centrarchus]|uniref:uncharacterized protein phf11 isoform X7 n=1 Tax=Archocentrus centrarchus TaxID=63155 RepID=UPI0011E9EA9E|nr:PHD finger protein 11 isoform X7 [Archocentrus centrarchus]